jgi:PAS domain S-box-containing protein
VTPTSPEARAAGLPGSLTPRERSVLRSRWRPVFPLALAVLSLVSLVGVLLHVEHRTRELIDTFAKIIDPARIAVTEIELNLALETSSASAYLLTGDPRFATNHYVSRAGRAEAQAELAPLARQLGPSITRATQTLRERLRGADATLDSLYDGRLPISAYTARLDSEQARFESIVSDAGRLEAAIGQSALAHRRELIDAQQLGAVLSPSLAVAASIALILLGRLGLGFQARAIRLDTREQQQSALREAARALNASVSVTESTRIIAEGALAATTADGAIVELTLGDQPERKIAAHVLMRGGDTRSATVSDEQSLTRALVSGQEIASDPRALLERMGVPPGDRSAMLRATTAPIVVDGEVRGSLAIVRPSSAARTREAEDLYLGALLELASSMLRRVELVSELRAAEERFRQVADNIRGFVWLRDPSTMRFLYANGAYEQIWGRSRAELYRNSYSWLEGVHPEDREHVQSVLPPNPPAPYELEYRVVRPNGDVRWVWSRGFPVRNAEGEIFRMAGVTEDITERKQTELELEELVIRERQAREASEAAKAAAESRQEELERVTESRTRLVRGFTHDVKNPLGAADGFLTLLEEGVFGELTSEQLDSITRSRNSIRRALELITGALELARADTAELELQDVVVDVREAIKDVAFEFHAQAEAKGQALTTNVAPDVPAIRSDPERIRQIIGNLLSNAIKYTPEHGQIGVGVSLAEGRAPAPGNWIVVDVMDNGPGIPSDQLPRLFQEFTRLNPSVAGGAGVGLAISQRLARALGGRITVESREGEGSKFSLWLPRSRSQRRSKAA